jgi:hypothetical protein
MADLENYGIDAPGVVGTLGIVGIAFLICGVLPQEHSRCGRAPQLLAIWPKRRRSLRLDACL